MAYANNIGAGSDKRSQGSTSTADISAKASSGKS